MGEVDDLREAAQSAFLLGRRDEAVELYQRAFRITQDDGDVPGGIACAFHLSMIFGTSGEPAMASGWSTRAERLLEQLGPDVMEAGYISFLQMYRFLGAADWQAAAEKAHETAETGRRFGERDLMALGQVASGRIAIYSGRAAEGLAHLDEVMVTLAAGEVSAEVFGNVYCISIEGCQEIGAVERVAEWSAALARWCDSQPSLVAFTGQCSIHRGQVMRQRGQWADAIEEFVRAGDRYRLANTLDAIGQAEGERGDVLRLQGDYAGAEAAYQRAGEHGYDAQPGLALLWLARGSRDAAVAAVRRLVAEVDNPAGQCRVLPSAVDVLLAVDAVDEARAVAADLDRLAADVGSTGLLAHAAYASGAVEIAGGDPSGALPYLRKARQLWARTESPYDGARVRALTGRALAAIGDEESARQELTAALATFRDLGARPAAEQVASLLEPARLPAGLTTREVEVLRLVAAGHSNPQIAADLTLSEKTVARHLSNIFAKLDVGSRTAAAAYAFEHGLV